MVILVCVFVAPRPQRFLTLDRRRETASDVPANETGVMLPMIQPSSCGRHPLAVSRLLSSERLLLLLVPALVALADHHRAVVGVALLGGDVPAQVARLLANAVQNL